MLRAGSQSAAVILRDYGDRVAHGVLVCAGAGNNGGDAYVVAAQLAQAGVRVRVRASMPPRSDDALRASRLARRYATGASHAMLHWDSGTPDDRDSAHNERVVVDGLLGTGHRGTLRASLNAALSEMARLRNNGATIVALDVPSGLDATTGECAAGMVSAHVTLMYGTVKRGALLSRAVSGRLLLLDIGLHEHACAGDQDGAWRMLNAHELASSLPSIAWNAHKGQRGHVAIVGGAPGMAGAVILAARAALASGIGIAHAWVDAPGVFSVQQSVPQAIAHAWLEHHDSSSERGPWGQALAVGPGLGRTEHSRRMLSLALARNIRIPAVLDADALTLLSLSLQSDGTTGYRVKDDVPREEALRDGNARHVHPAERIRMLWSQWRPVVCTPHVGEFARLICEPVSNDWTERAAQANTFAQRADVTLLLKGTPTLVATPDNAPVIAVARGSAVLATGGSGDMLTGIIGTLLAQGVAPRDAAVIGATAHGLAAEIAAHSARGIRGVTLDDVLRALPAAWHEIAVPSPLPPSVLMEWPSPQGVQRDAHA